ncbi:hypothetical protein PC128_g27804 [Phytophthora cactorum]|nr:hypothetical protein PC128_g27804 [Phytophthora cactorum]
MSVRYEEAELHLVPVYGAALPVQTEVVEQVVSTLATTVETSDGTPEEQVFAVVS